MKAKAKTRATPEGMVQTVDEIRDLFVAFAKTTDTEEGANDMLRAHGFEPTFVGTLARLGTQAMADELSDDPRLLAASAWAFGFSFAMHAGDRLRLPPIEADRGEA